MEKKITQQLNQINLMASTLNVSISFVIIQRFDRPPARGGGVVFQRRLSSNRNINSNRETDRQTQKQNH